MDPIIGGALVKGGLGLLGGLFGQRSQRKQAARQEYLRSPAGIRAESEKAGFNPLTVLQSGRDLAADLYRPVIGDALANAGMAVGDGMQQAAMEKTRLQMHNDNLKARLKALSLKPVPNQYGRTTGTGQPITAYNTPGMDVAGPFLDPASKNAQRIPVFMPWHNEGDAPGYMLASTAERLGHSAGDQLTMGELAEVQGEVAEIGGIFVPDDISAAQFGRYGSGTFLADKNVIRWPDTVQNNSSAGRRNMRRFMPSVTGQTPSRGSIGRRN